MSNKPRRDIRIGETVTMGTGKPSYIAVEAAAGDQCGRCECPDCRNINCDASSRPDRKNIILKKIER